MKTKWEYLHICKTTVAGLLEEINSLGAQGWRLIPELSRFDHSINAGNSHAFMEREVFDETKRERPRS